MPAQRNGPLIRVILMITLIFEKLMTNDSAAQ